MAKKKYTFKKCLFLLVLSGLGFTEKVLSKTQIAVLAIKPINNTEKDPEKSNASTNPTPTSSEQPSVTLPVNAKAKTPQIFVPKVSDPKASEPKILSPQPPSTAGSTENSYVFLKKKFGHHPVRLLFFWTAGIFGLSPHPTPFGGSLEKEFFQQINQVLNNLPFVTVEIMTDKRTWNSSQAHFNQLSSSFDNRFRISFIEDILHAFRESPEKNLLAKKKTALLLEGLENATKGNPALASDIARIYFLHNPEFPLNLYIDVDTFVFNARQKLHLIFPSNPRPNNPIRMDLNNGLKSNDILASYGLKTSFEPVRHRLLESLEDPERRAILQHSCEKNKAVSFSDCAEGFEFYKDSVHRLIKVLKDDIHRIQNKRKFTVFYNGKDRGLLFVIALLKTTGTACEAGASSFEKEFYQGLKPSMQTWGTFAWPSVDDLMAHPQMATFFAYLFDWETLKRTEKKDFLRKLAEEILRLHSEVKPSYALDKVTKKQDNLTYQAHCKVLKILKDVQNFIAGHPR